ncbi:MAG: P-loop NTPase, partial [Candidatus Aramenus sp.]|nr:P-loop NTPase [Candidatus Aramenus sp.]
MRIVVTGIKGGVGKSAIAYSLAKEISNEKPVLILDMDSTLTISRMLGLKQG